MRVIVTSAYGADVAAASLQVRIERFIRKPYSLGNLVDLIRQAVTAADEGRTRADIR
jgi:hypothetical protein